MARRLTMLGAIMAVGLMLGGCTKCGPIWDDWIGPSKACRSDRF